MDGLTRDNYRIPKEENWQGRNVDPTLGIQYWYQAVVAQDLKVLSQSDERNLEVGIIGYACDEGVRRNQGRVGTSEAPKYLRERLSRLAWHHSLRVTDFGDILCKDQDLEKCQLIFSQAITFLLNKNIFPIAIGGGHDISLAHFNGIYNHLSTISKPRIGIINFDAHFDLRPEVDGPTSGTSFHKILSDHIGRVDYLALGIQRESNTRELFDIADRFGVKYILSPQFNELNRSGVVRQIDAFISEVDHLYISIDMDGFSSAHAPGVSAPSPMGFSPLFAIDMLEHIFHSKKVVSLDIAEANPKYDMDNATFNLAARLVDRVISFLT